MRNVGKEGKNETREGKGGKGERSIEKMRKIWNKRGIEKLKLWQKEKFLFFKV
jgi:hypothetical protein